MANQLRKKLALISVIVYWPTIFFLTHIPMPKVVHQANLSDKNLHFMAYFILVFLLWGAIKPYSKVSWRESPVWLLLALIVWYGVVDEWLQCYVDGRSADVRDFFSDLMGALASLGILSVLTFWQALLAMSAMTVFVLINSSQGDITQLLPITTAIIFPLLFAGFTGLTFFSSYTSKIPNFSTGNGDSRWLPSTLLPLGLLIIVKVGAILLHRHLATLDVIISGATIMVTAFSIWLAHKTHKILTISRKVRLSQNN